MAEKTATYTVQLAKNFDQATHWRVGIEFERNVPQVLELTKEQVEAIKNDRYMEIKKGAPKDKGADAGNSDADALPTVTTGETTEDAATTSPQDEVQAPEGGTEESAGDTVDLLQKGRSDLNAIAEQAGVVDAKKLPSKQAVVDAILATQGE